MKPTGIMNYIQRLFIAERCGPGARVIDVCCGRGLQLPVLYRYAPHIACYLGLDITQAHLDEARGQSYRAGRCPRSAGRSRSASRSVMSPEHGRHARRRT